MLNSLASDSPIANPPSDVHVLEAWQPFCNGTKCTQSQEQRLRIGDVGAEVGVYAHDIGMRCARGFQYRLDFLRKDAQTICFPRRQDQCRGWFPSSP